MNYFLWLLYNVYIYSKESFVILCCRCNMLEIIKFLIEGLIMGFLGLFGIVGNVVSIAVLSSTELDMMPAFRHLMKMLGAFDAIFLVIKWELGSIFYTSFTTRLCIMDYLTYILTHKVLRTYFRLSSCKQECDTHVLKNLSLKIFCPDQDRKWLLSKTF